MISKLGRVIINPIIGPIVIFSLFIFLFALFYMPKVSQDNQKKSIEADAKVLISHLKSFRDYYTSNVVEKVLHSKKISIDFNHIEQNQTIPLPATILYDLSGIFMKDSDMAFSMYSDYPFPNRSNRKLDRFQQEAIVYLRQNPKDIYAKEEQIDSRKMYRVAIADTFNSQTCINCHNRRVDSPKNNWKLNEVRGIFEVNRELKEDIVLSPKQVNYFLFILLIIVIFALLHYSIVYFRRSGELKNQAIELEKEVEKRTMDLVESNNMLMEYKKAVDASAIVSKTDPNGRITYVNDAFCEISGYEMQELLGKSHNIVRCKDIPSSFYQTMWETIKAKKIFKGTIRNRAKNGDPYYVTSTIVPILDSQNNISEFLSLRYNVTDLELAKKELELVNKNFKDSIEYASLIQDTFIPEDNEFSKFFSEYFAIWEPKDIVGGDIYIFEELRDGNECLLFVIDCTGHGVHGAFVTMIVKAIERHIVARIEHNLDEVVSPANLLGVFNRSMKHLLKQDRDNSLSNAGFDGTILYYNKKEKIVKFAGARSEIYYTQNGELHRIKGDRHSVGYRDSSIDYQFSDRVIDVSMPSTFYILSDGYVDQVGGEKRLSFGKRRLEKLINSIKEQMLNEQKEEFIHALKRYQNHHDRLDDITMIGLKVD